MKKVLGLDLGTNSIGWALIQSDLENRNGKILGAGVRIIPMGQDALSKYDSGVGISRTADRTHYRSVRRLYQRNKLRRDRLHRTLNILGYLPEHYANEIDFKKHFGQFKKETKLNYKPTEKGYQFIFMDSFLEMSQEFKSIGYSGPIPYDWTIYYLRTKALTDKITKEELAWIILNFNQKRGYYQLRGKDTDETKNQEFVQLKVKELLDTGEKVKGQILFNVVFENGWRYDKKIVKKENWIGRTKEFIVTKNTLKSGETKISYKAVDSQVDWPAVKAKTEQNIKTSGKSVGQFIYESLKDNAKQKIRGKLIKTIERKFYKQELVAILLQQAKYHPELTSEIKLQEVIEHLYPKNISQKNKLKGKNIQYLLIEDLIFYQRPLKSKKSTIGLCSYEFRTYKRLGENDSEIEVKEYLRAIPKSHPLYQEFRLWQFVKNLKIIDTTLEATSKNKNDSDVTITMLSKDEEWVDLYEYLYERSEVEEKHILDYLIQKGKITKQEKKENKYRWNYVSSKRYPCNTTRADLLKRLSKVANLNPKYFLTPKIEKELWHLIYSVKDKVEFEKALETFATKKEIDVESFKSAFLKTPAYNSDFGTLSHKAITKLLRLMRMGRYWSLENIDKKTRDRINKIISGEYDQNIRDRVREKSYHLSKLEQFSGLPLWLASYILYDRHSELGDIQQWKSPKDINHFLQNFKQHSLRNPIVEQVITETLRVVRDIWQSYGEGKESYFTNINLELGRELKNSNEKRKRISDRNRENQNTNTRIRHLLKELMEDNSVQGDVRPFSPSHQEILKIYEEGLLQNPNVDYSRVSEDEIENIRKKNTPSKNDLIKYKLWLEQGYISPYTGAIIPLSKLFTTDFEIEHIIPQSRYFDNSLSNKVICETDVNKDKGNKTAYEYLLIKGGDIVDGHELLGIETYEKHCQKYFKKNRKKLANLLSEEIPEGFINRQLNDSRYIAKYIKGLLSNIVREEGEQEPTSKYLLPVSGAITAKLKQDWGLNDKWNELIAPRFKRLNKMTNSTDYGYEDSKINSFRITVPEEIKRGFSKKRIDHRHHTLDAIVLALTTREQVNYLNSLNANRENYSLKAQLLKKNKRGDYTKHFLEPFSSLANIVLDNLNKVIVSFKKNNRVINKTNNKTWQWVHHEGHWIKKLIKQDKGDSWSIRKSLHKETVSGKINIINIGKNSLATATRVSISTITNQKHIDKISDSSIRKILNNHLKNYLDINAKPQYAEAFSQVGIEDLNKNIAKLNGGKPHMPILKVRQYEVGKKFAVGYSGNNPRKYVEAAKGTNLFFAVYWNETKKKRVYESIPLHEVIEHQKQVAHLSKNEKLPIPPNPEKGKFLFSLSPNDLLYIPSQEEITNPNLFDIQKVEASQALKIYVMVSTTQNKLQCRPATIAKMVSPLEVGSSNKSERSLLDLHQNIYDKSGKPVMIKDICWKLTVDRLGNIISVNYGVIK